MAEATQFMFDYQEVLQELIQKQGIHEGRWKLIFELGFSATNLLEAIGPNQFAARPAGVVLVKRIGLTQTEEDNNLTLDASKVNPKQPTKSTKRPQKALSKSG